MNIYINMINQTLDYIEENICEKIKSEDIAGNFYLSRFHFDRIFSVMLGKTIKQYILGRKLTEAYKSLMERNTSVTDVAYDFGFEYPEVFSRAFKKQFGAAPSSCSEESFNRYRMDKAKVVERDIINYKGTLTLDGKAVYLSELHLRGVYTEVDTKDIQFKLVLQSACDEFMKASQKADWLCKDLLYTVVNCHEKDNGEYTVFHGMKEEGKGRDNTFRTRVVPEGWYQRFIYKGDMFDIREAFMDDLYRWIIVKEVELHSNGVGMLNIFEKDYLETGEVQIFVPIKGPQ